jgi:hypothetical protein
MGGDESSERTGEVSGPEAAPGSLSGEADAGTVGAEVLGTLQAHGYAHVRRTHTARDFDAVAQRLGAITLRTDLTLTPNRSSIVYKPDGITFHQDNPTMHILGWHCVRQDELDGSMQLLDAGDVSDHFSRRELEVMSGIRVKCPELDPGLHNPDRGLSAYFLWPLLVEKAARTDVYYVPWLLVDSDDEEEHRTLAKFDAYLRAKEAGQLISIRLKAGESLFIDNNRMLHGRGALQQDSKRFLKRVWIRRPL